MAGVQRGLAQHQDQRAALLRDHSGQAFGWDGGFDDLVVQVGRAPEPQKEGLAPEPAKPRVQGNARKISRATLKERRMLAHIVGLAALLAYSMPASPDAVVDAECLRATLRDRSRGFDVLPSPDGGQVHGATQAPDQADDFERTAAKRAEFLAGTDYARLGTCQGLVRDLHRWGVVDNLATGIAFGLINNTSRIARRAEAIGNHRLARESAEFVIGFCTATMHVHMANPDGAKDVLSVVVPSQAVSAVLQSRIARLQGQDTLDPDRCRGQMGKLRDAEVIDEVAEVMLRRELDDAIEEGTVGAPGQEPGGGFGHGLCSAVLNAVMGALR